MEKTMKLSIERVCLLPSRLSCFSNLPPQQHLHLQQRLKRINFQKQPVLRILRKIQVKCLFHKAVLPSPVGIHHQQMEVPPFPLHPSAPPTSRSLVRRRTVSWAIQNDAKMRSYMAWKSIMRRVVTRQYVKISTPSSAENLFSPSSVSIPSAQLCIWREHRERENPQLLPHHPLEKTRPKRAKKRSQVHHNNTCLHHSHIFFTWNKEKRWSN